MMNWLVTSALKLRVLMIAGAAALVFFGVDRLRTMGTDILPEFALPIIEIQTEAQGLSAKEVEIMVSFGVEELVSGLPWIKTLTSESVAGLSTVRLEFEPGTNLIKARQLVQERLTSSFLLPNVARAPVMQQPTSATNRVMMIALSSKDIDPLQLSIATTWTVKPRLLGVPGVANVAIWGERRRQLQIQIDPEKLRANNLKQNQVIASTGDSLWVSSLSWLKASTPGTGGWIEGPNQRLEIRHVLPMSSAADMARIGIDGTNLKLGDVAKVVEGHPPMIGDAVVADPNGLLLVVEKFPGADTLAVTKAVEEALASMKAGLPGVEIDSQTFRPATFSEWSLANSGQAAIAGGLLVLLAVAAILFSGPAAIVTIVSIGVSMLIACLVLYFRGTSLNALVIAGFAAAFGCMIDDVVVATECLAQRLRGRRGVNDVVRDMVTTAAIGVALGSNFDDVVGASETMARHQRSGERATGDEVRDMVTAATLEMRRPLVYASLISLLLLVPIFFIDSVDGFFFEPLAVSYALALIASLIVSLTLAPALTWLLVVWGGYLRPARALAVKRPPPLQRLGEKVFSGLAASAVERPVLGLIVAGLLVVGAGIATPTLYKQMSSQLALLPDFRERDLMIRFESAPGTSHPEMLRLTRKVAEELRAVSGVRSVAAHFGRAVSGDQTVTVNSGRLWVGINASADYERTLAGVHKTLDAYPAVTRSVHGYLGERLGKSLPGSPDQITVRVYGASTGELRAISGQVKSLIDKVDGIADARVIDQIEEPQLQVKVDLAAASENGLKPGDVRRAASTFFSGLEVGKIFESQKVFDVVVWSTPESRRDIPSLENMMIELPRGGHVRLGDVAKVSIEPTASIVRREGLSLYLDVVANVRNRSWGETARDVDLKLKELKLPVGYFPVLLNQVASRAMQYQRTLVAGLIAALGVVFLLQAALNNWRLAFSAFVLTPLAVTGCLAAAVITGRPFSIATLTAVFAVYAVAMRLILVLLSHIQVLDAANPPHINGALVAQAVQDRASAIMLTLVSLALACVPSIYLAGQPGLEILGPMAVSVLGGLITTTLVVLLVLPALSSQVATVGTPVALDVEMAR